MLLNHHHKDLNKGHSTAFRAQLVFLKTKKQNKTNTIKTKNNKQSNYCERQTNIILGDIDTA